MPITLIRSKLRTRRKGSNTSTASGYHRLPHWSPIGRLQIPEAAYEYEDGESFVSVAPLEPDGQPVDSEDADADGWKPDFVINADGKWTCEI